MYSNRGRIYAKKVIFDKITFDSEQECQFYKELKQRDDIINLECHKSYCLQKEFVTVNGKVHKAITYEPDFVYFDTTDERMHFVDVKGFVTEEFALKWKMFDKWLFENAQGCYLEVLKYSKTTGFVPIENYKKEMRTRRQQLVAEKNYYKNIVKKQEHDKQVLENKRNREIARLKELRYMVENDAKMTREQKARYNLLKERYPDVI